MLLTRRGYDCLVVGFTITYMHSVPINTKVVSSNPLHGEVYSIQHYVVKFFSDLFHHYNDTAIGGHFLP
jgi:hypothetical protein